MPNHNIIPFDFQSHSVRVIYSDPLNPVFVAQDVAKALGYRQHKQAIAQHCKGVAKHVPLETDGGSQLTRVITEPDLYRLIFGSKLKSAAQFQDWVFDEVLPSIRKTGEYKTQYTANPADSLSAEQADLLRTLMNQAAEQLPQDSKAKFMVQGWSKLKSHFNVGYRAIPQSEYTEAVSIVSRHITEALQGEFIPQADNSNMFHGIKDGRYLLHVTQGQTTIRNIDQYSIVDARFTRAIQHNFKTLAQQLMLLSGDASPSVLDLQLRDIKEH